MLIYEDVCWSDLFEGGGSKATVEPLTVTENGMYTAPGGVVYSPVTVDVSLGPDDGGDKPFEDLTWDQVIASTQTGKYKTFTVGDMKELDLGTEGVVHMQIVGIDVDDLADGSGKAPLTFISKELLKTSHRMNPARTPSSAPYDEGTGAIGGWDKSEMKQYILGTVVPNLPEVIRNNVKTVKKYTRIFNTAGTAVNDVETDETFWLASRREMLGTVGNAETKGPIYSEVFPDNASRIKEKVGATSSVSWWLRSAGNTGKFYYVYTDGSGSSNSVTNSYGVSLGFCL